MALTKNTDGIERVTVKPEVKRPKLLPKAILLGGEGNGYPLQCSCLGNPVDRGAWWATVHGVAKSWTQLKPLSMHMAVIKHKEIES